MKIETLQTHFSKMELMDLVCKAYHNIDGQTTDKDKPKATAKQQGRAWAIWHGAVDFKNAMLEAIDEYDKWEIRMRG